MASGFRPKKNLGQHFLTDISAARSIVESMGIDSGDTVLEIGPGQGVLTEFLLDSPAREIIAVEIDRKLALFIKVCFDSDSRFRVVEEDFMKFDLGTEISGQGKMRIVGNLPYNITSPILFRLLDHRAGICNATLTVQKEVADRLVSAPGGKTYGIPSVLFQLYAHLEQLFHLPRRVFHPVPKVDSSVVQVTFLEQPVFPVTDEIFFRRLVKTAFGQRRKMLRNSLKKILQEKESNIQSVFDLTKRPEELTVEDFVMLSNRLTAC